MTETTLRFLQEISDRAGRENVTELHVFSPIRQGGQESGVAVVATTPETVTADGVERHVIYTARYRHTIKGVDRGRWEFDLKAEADATLITVDEVVRGVSLRFGDSAQVERMTADEFKEHVPAPPAPESEPVSQEATDSPQPDNDPE